MSPEGGEGPWPSVCGVCLGGIGGAWEMGGLHSKRRERGLAREWATRSIWNRSLRRCGKSRGDGGKRRSLGAEPLASVVKRPHWMEGRGWTRHLPDPPFPLFDGSKLQGALETQRSRGQLWQSGTPKSALKAEAGAGRWGGE